MRINLLSLDILLIDTVHLWTDNYQWSGDESGWDSISEERNPLSSHSQSSAFPNRLVRCRSLDVVTGWNIWMSSVLKISGSIPKLIHGDNFLPIHTIDMKSVKEYIIRRADVLGLKFDVNSLKVSRADFASNKQFTCSSKIVISELSKLTKCGVLPRIMSSQFYEGTSCLWGNKERQLLIYDKTQEIKKRKGTNGNIKNNYIRSEVRLLTGRSCKRAGINNFNSLSDKIAQIDVWRELNLSLLNRAKEIGICNDRTTNLDLLNRIEDILLLPNSSTRQLVYTIAGLGLDAFYSLYGGPLMFDKYLLNLNFNRTRRSRIQTHLKQVHRESNRSKDFSVKHNIWNEYESWIHSL